MERTLNVAAESALVKVRNKSTIRRFGSATKPFRPSLRLAIADIRSGDATVLDDAVGVVAVRREGAAGAPLLIAVTITARQQAESVRL
ncbi:hypothetical protein ABTX60_36715 [Streptomyces sp. NPDC126510]|uniref:hypothetical protein n=1 Tax=Streptomyces sp. NPDC126510 TaxID=3155317 RepID=UPI003320CEFC